jgi:hypothetical protein
VDLEEFLDLPLVARLAVSGARGRPTVRPVWFLYEEGSFWWLTASSYSELGMLLTVDARASLVIDTCDLSTGAVLAVTVTGTAVVRPFDAERATRKLRKYLGPDGTTWPTQFTGVFMDPTSRLVELHPDHPVRLRDLSFTPGTAAWMLEGTRPKVLGLGVRRSGGPSHVGHGLPVTVVCGAGPIVVRRATSADLEAIVALLGDDPLGSMREAGADSDLDPYRDAMSTIEADPAQSAPCSCRSFPAWPDAGVCERRSRLSEWAARFGALGWERPCSSGPSSTPEHAGAASCSSRLTGHAPAPTGSMSGWGSSTRTVGSN